jgi:glycerol uptake facilitator-like aquaporin
MTLWRKGLSEFIGTCGLLIVVVGSGIMGENLAQGNVAIALLANSIATGCGLYVLIQAFAGTSGAHFNPIVSFFELISKRLSKIEFMIYFLSQLSGAMIGVWLTHLMFGQSMLQFSTHDRAEFRFFLSEALATFGLIMTIVFVGKAKPTAIPSSVALYITAAYWCTSSTSFANPAVTIARSFTNTFAGIQANGVFGFILAQTVGCLTMLFISKLMDGKLR